ncbi:ATP-binding cassette domain-containing protein [Bartonella krasnovii]|nr:ATP-binding cassette domain-containing protein [Bartonella krasnovii]
MSAAKSHDSGQLVLEAKKKNFKILWGSRYRERFLFAYSAGERIGLVGPNGIGKTTLLSTLIGQEAVDSGTVRHGYNLSIALLDQQRILNEEETLAHYLTGGGVILL